MPPRQGGGEGGNDDVGPDPAAEATRHQDDNLLPSPPASSFSSFMRSTPTENGNSAVAPSVAALDHEQQQRALPLALSASARGEPEPQSQNPQPPRPRAFLPPPPYSSFTLNLIAGSGAGIVETILTYPLDLVRTRFQMARNADLTSSSNYSSIITKTNALGHPPHLSPTVAGMLIQISKDEGVYRLYRGLLPPLLSEVPRRALKFSANDFFKDLLQSPSSSSGPFPNNKGKLHAVWVDENTCLAHHSFVFSFLREVCQM